MTFLGKMSQEMKQEGMIQGFGKKKKKEGGALNDPRGRLERMLGTI